MVPQPMSEAPKTERILAYVGYGEWAFIAWRTKHWFYDHGERCRSPYCWVPMPSVPNPLRGA